MFWNVAGVNNKDRDFWNFVYERDYISLSETWMEEKGWEMIKNRFPKTHAWEYSFALKEKKKGRAKSGFLIDKKKDWDTINRIMEKEDEGVVISEIKERKKTLFIIEGNGK